jgi:hypothetical protein
MRARLERPFVVAVIVLGVATRLVLAVLKPLGLDEAFTLYVAHLDGHLALAALRQETNAPLHYVLAHLLVAPFGKEPGPADALVRASSLVSSLAQFPLLVRLARRCSVSAPWACALLAVSPLAVFFAAEARPYALGMLLVLLCYERAFALRDAPGLGRAGVLAVAAAAAVLTHYAAVFPLVGLVALLPGAGTRASRQIVIAGLGGAALGMPWLSVILAQPAGALTWIDYIPNQERLVRAALNLVLGWDVAGPPLVLGIVAVGLLVLVFVVPPRPPAAAALPLALASAVALAACLVWPGLALPQRLMAVFLPLVALAVAGAAWPLRWLVLVLQAGLLAVSLPDWSVPSPTERMAESLVAHARAGRVLCVVGIYGPELDYRFRRAGLPGRVVLFPEDMIRHRGWHDDAVPSRAALRAQAAAVVGKAPPPDVFVLPHGSRASAALREALDARGAVVLGHSPIVDVLALSR